MHRSDQWEVINNTATQFASHPSAVSASGLPIVATFGFVPGQFTASEMAKEGLDVNNEENLDSYLNTKFM